MAVVTRRLREAEELVSEADPAAFPWEDSEKAPAGAVVLRVDLAAAGFCFS